MYHGIHGVMKDYNLKLMDLSTSYTLGYGMDTYVCNIYLGEGHETLVLPMSLSVGHYPTAPSTHTTNSHNIHLHTVVYYNGENDNYGLGSVVLRGFIFCLFLSDKARAKWRTYVLI